MNFLKLYGRVLVLLGPEARLGWILAGANVALAAAQFAEPVLFGRIIDALVKGQTAGATPSFTALTPLLAAWVGFGLFIIGCSVLVALHADRLSHRRKQAVTTMYFEHVMQLPLSFPWRHPFGPADEGDAHRRRCAVGAVAVVLPRAFRGLRRAVRAAAAVAADQLAARLAARRALRGVHRADRAGHPQDRKLQSKVEGHYTALAERASDALSNVALVQGFARVEAEVTSLRSEVDRLLAAQMPVLSWWAMIAVLTRSATTLTMLSIFLLGIYLNSQNLATIGEIVTFMNFAGLLIVRLEQVVGFTNRVLMEAPRLREFFDVLDTVPAVRDRPDAIDPGRLRGLIEFDDVSFSYDGKRAAVADLSFTALPGETIALVGPTGAGKSTALALLHRAFDPQSGLIKIDGMDIHAIKLAALRHNIGVVFQEALLFNRSIAENLRVGNPDATDAQLREAAARAQATELIERHPGGARRLGRRARPLALRRRAAAPLDRARC